MHRHNLMLFRFLQSNPAVRILIPFIIGIYTSSILIVSSINILLCILLILIILIVLKDRPFSLQFGYFIFLFFFLSGFSLVQSKKESNTVPRNLSKHYIKAIVNEPPKKLDGKFSVPLTVVQVKSRDNIEMTNFKTIAYFYTNNEHPNWSYRDTIITKLSFKYLKKKTNINPSYEKYLHNKLIYTIAYGDIDNILLENYSGFSIKKISKGIQKSLSHIIQEKIQDDKVSGFLQALVLGNKKNLSSEIRKEFSNSGVIHILAVSGLHVGILFLLINLILKPLRTTKQGRITLVLLSIVLIWFFAFITGLSVSVMRAAIMFSVLQLSILSLRPYRIYNAIAVSALIVLFYNPFYLFEVGFLLSYGAVLSIVTFVPLWNKKVIFKNPLIDKIKVLLFVSLAAQIGVAPLVLYYFHQLPTYFLISNIIVLILAPCLLGGTLLLLVVSSINTIAQPIAYLLTIITKFGLESVSEISTLPHSQLINYTIDYYQLIIIYGIILCILFYKIKKSSFYFITLLVFVFTLFTHTFIKEYDNNNKVILESSISIKQIVNT